MNERFGMEIEGGVPVYHPSFEEFRDFKKFVKEIEPMGMQSGIVKIVPPQEWLDSLPEITEEMENSIKIKNPIQQEVDGTHGVFMFRNIQKSRSYDIHSWRKTCSDVSNQPPADRGKSRKNRKVDTYDKVSQFDDSEFTQEKCDELQKTYWKSLGFSTPIYGADMPGSLFNDSLKEWNVANLDSVLSNLQTKIPGVNTAYLYCGMWKATFAWHLEDMDLHSINYIHFGAPKQWYSIPQSDRERFYRYMRLQWPLEYRRCREFLRHKTFLVSPTLLESQGIRVNKVVHRQKEFIITFPYGYHAGFNYGYNVAESVNFATDLWLDIGLQSNNCRCISDSVGIDVAKLIRTINGEPEPDEFEEENSQLMTPPSEETAKIQHPKKKRKTSSSAKAAAPTKKPTSSSQYTIVSGRAKKRGECMLCPHKWDDEYLVNEAKNAKTHRICAEFIPECWVEDNIVQGLDSISKDRFGLRCSDCRSALGACFQCSHPRCTRAFHATCAANAGVVTMNGEYLCRQHRPRNTIPTDRDLGTIEYAAALLTGDTIQCQTAAGKTFAGIVQENNLDENMILINCHPNFDDVLEIAHKWVVPGKLEPISSVPPVKTKDDIAEKDKKAEALLMLGVPPEQPHGRMMTSVQPAINLKQEHIEVPMNLAPPALHPPAGPPVDDGPNPFIFMGVPLPTCLARSTPL